MEKPLMRGVSVFFICLTLFKIWRKLFLATTWDFWKFFSIELSCVLVFQPLLQTGNGALTCRPPECWEDVSCQFNCCKKMQIFTSLCLCMRMAFLFPDGFQILQTGGYSEDMIPTVSMFFLSSSLFTLIQLNLSYDLHFIFW